jgi:hypothetical protein
VAVPVPRAAVRAGQVARRMVKLGVAAQGAMGAPVGTAVWAWPRPMRTRRCRLVTRAPVVKSDRRAQVDRAVVVETDRFLSAVVAAEAAVPEVLQPREPRPVAVVVDRLDCGQWALNVWSSLSRWSPAGAAAMAAQVHSRTSLRLEGSAAAAPKAPADCWPTAVTAVAAAVVVAAEPVARVVAARAAPRWGC